MSDLPHGWVRATVDDTGVYINGMAFKPEDWEVEGRPIIRIQNLTNPEKALNRTTKAVEPRYLVEKGDILVSWSATLDAFIWDREQSILNQHIFKVVPEKSAINKRFLFHGLRSVIRELISGEHLHGSTMKHINRGPFLAHPFLLPPLPEQRRIVAKIDSLTEKSRRARDHLDHIPRLVEKYKQAILAAAFHGDWPTRPAGDIIRNVVAGKNMRCEERPPRESENGVVKVSAVSWGAFDAQASKTLPANFVPPPHTKIQNGDLLISRANTLELVGAVVIVAEAPSNLFLSDKVLRLEVEPRDKPWLMWFLRSPAGRATIEENATGNQLSMRNLSQSALKSIQLPWPPVDQRQQIIHRIETAFAWIDRLAADATSARKLIDHLDQAVLAKAFRGELVPQDPTDEPASVLLDRIRAEREAAPKTKRGRKKTA